MQSNLSKHLAASVAAVAICAGPSAAQELSFGATVDIVSDYLYAGVSQTDGNPALQTYLNAFYGNFYAGAFLSNVDLGTPDTLEYDFYVGYFHPFANGVVLDINYAWYFYDDFGFDSEAVTASAAIPVGSKITFTPQLEYNFTYEALGTQLTVDYAVNDALTLSAEFGDSEFYDHQHWSVGGTYAVTDKTSLTIAYHGLSEDSIFSDAGLHAGLSMNF